MYIQCDCSVDADGDDPSFRKQAMRRARKSHRCVECERLIEPGEQYEHVCGVWDEEWSTFRTCLGCYRIREHLCGDGWCFGEVAAQVAECIGFDYTAEES